MPSTIKPSVTNIKIPKNKCILCTKVDVTAIAVNMQNAFQIAAYQSPFGTE